MSNRFAVRILMAAVIAGAVTSSPQALFAQGNSLFSGSGLTKGSTGGISGGLGASGFGGSTSGASGRGGATGGTTGSGLMGALGSATGGGTGFGGANGQTGTGLGGTANSGFTGRNNAGFAGNSRAGQTTGAAGGAARNFSRTGNSSANNQLNNNLNRLGGNERQTSTVRPRQRVAFDYNAKSPTTIAANVTTRLDRMSVKNRSFKDVDVTVQDNQIVLTGKVKTQQESRLMENLVRLEPGVKSVRNDIQVEQPTEID